MVLRSTRVYLLWSSVFGHWTKVKIILLSVAANSRWFLKTLSQVSAGLSWSPTSLQGHLLAKILSTLYVMPIGSKLSRKELRLQRTDKLRIREITEADKVQTVSAHRRTKLQPVCSLWWRWSMPLILLTKRVRKTSISFVIKTKNQVLRPPCEKPFSLVKTLMLNRWRASIIYQRRGMSHATKVLWSRRKLSGQLGSKDKESKETPQCFFPKDSHLWLDPSSRRANGIEPSVTSTNGPLVLVVSHKCLNSLRRWFIWWWNSKLTWQNTTALSWCKKSKPKDIWHLFTKKPRQTIKITAKCWTGPVDSTTC